MRRACFPLCAIASLLTGCAPTQPASPAHFSRDGRTIAFSGADAGPANACFTCHGLAGEGDGDATPRLAGLDAGYLQRQLDGFADGRRRHSRMAWIARQLDETDRVAVSRYYARLSYEPRAGQPSVAAPAIYVHGDAERGLPACAECHGRLAEGGGPANPPLAGQPANYLARQLDHWRTGMRRNDPGAVMARISQLLTPSEIREASAYAGSLTGDASIPAGSAGWPRGHRADPRSGVSGPPLHVPESARARE